MRNNGKAGHSAPTLPDEALDALTALRGELDGREWDAAELLCDIDDELKQRMPRKFAADALGVMPSTVGAWINTARRTGEYRRDTRLENLSFSHFMYAARSVYPLAILVRAVESADDYGGKPAPVRVVRQWLAEENVRQHKPKPTLGTATVDEIYNVDGMVCIRLLVPSDAPLPRVKDEIVYTLPEA